MSSQIIPRSLSAKYKEDFAYPTVKDRLPVILTKVVDQVYRLKVEATEKYGEAGVEDLKLINSHLSQLKNELQTNKVLKPLTDNWRDVDIWNKHLSSEEEQMDEGCAPSWFNSSWLYIECFFYRKIHEAIQKSSLLKGLDPFGKQKEEAFITSESAMDSTAAYLLSNMTSVEKSKKKELFLKLLKVSLWGNKCDLSISSGSENSQKDDPFSSLDALESYLLVDDSEKVWNKLMQLQECKPGKVRLDIVLDNAGFELFTDLCFIEFVLSLDLVSSVIIHPKSFPWFVSDVTDDDLKWTFDQFINGNNSSMASLGKSLQEKLENKSLVIFYHDFWTLPYDYPNMNTVAPDLYAELAKSDLIIFKGDLNYRKLTQDRKWDHTTSFETSFHGFNPSTLCALRTLKSDSVVGLKPGQAEEAKKKKVPTATLR